MIQMMIHTIFLTYGYKVFLSSLLTLLFEGEVLRS